jgi:ribosomal protein L29
LFNFHLAGNEGSGPAMMINEVDDPELRMALELSLLDEQHRLAAQAAAGQVSNPANANE